MDNEIKEIKKSVDRILEALDSQAKNKEESDVQIHERLNSLESDIRSIKEAVITPQNGRQSASSICTNENGAGNMQRRNGHANNMQTSNEQANNTQTSNGQANKTQASNGQVNIAQTSNGNGTTQTREAGETEPPPPYPYSPRCCYMKMWPNFDGFGFKLNAERGIPGHKISHVDDNSPASTAGLRVGDRVVEVNGGNTEHLKKEDFISMVESITGSINLLVLDQESDNYYRYKYPRMRIRIYGTDRHVIRMYSAEPPVQLSQNEQPEPALQNEQPEPPEKPERPTTESPSALEAQEKIISVRL